MDGVFEGLGLGVFIDYCRTVYGGLPSSLRVLSSQEEMDGKGGFEFFSSRKSSLCFFEDGMEWVGVDGWMEIRDTPFWLI